MKKKIGLLISYQSTIRSAYISFFKNKMHGKYLEYFKQKDINIRYISTMQHFKVWGITFNLQSIEQHFRIFDIEGYF